MKVPSGNILNAALSVIQKQAFTYFAFTSRKTNEIGLDVANYALGVDAMGSAQPVPRNVYQNLGLDFQRTYFNFFVPSKIIDINRDVSGDQFEYNGQRFQCLSNTPWFGIDGWNQVLCVAVTCPC